MMHSYIRIIVVIVTIACLEQVEAWFSKALELCASAARSGEEVEAQRGGVKQSLREAMTQRGAAEAVKEGCGMEQVRVW